MREFGTKLHSMRRDLAHSPQAVKLDLSPFAGRISVELNAGTLVSADQRE